MGERALRKQLCFFIRRTLQNCFLEKSLKALTSGYTTYYPAQKWHKDIGEFQFERSEHQP